MTAKSTSITYAAITYTMADVRCIDCGKLIIKWRRSGNAVIEYKCPRCGDVARLTLST